MTELTQEIPLAQVFEEIFSKEEISVTEEKDKVDKAKGKIPQVFQGNAITDARYEMSAVEKQLVYVLLSCIRKEQREQNILTYTVHIKDIEAYSAKTITNYQSIRDATKKIVGRVYEIIDKDKKTGKKTLTQTALISKARYVEGTGMVELTINEDIKPYLMDLIKGFTTYSLDYALSLRSTYSQRIYELLSRFKDLGSWRVKLSDLRYILKIDDKYEGYGMFKQKVLVIAQLELAAKTDISFTVEEVKRARKVYELIFVINQKKETRELVLEFNEDEKLKNKLLNEFRLAAWQADMLLKTLDRPTLHKTLYDIKMQINDHKVSNPGAYSWKVLNNVIMGQVLKKK